MTPKARPRPPAAIAMTSMSAAVASPGNGSNEPTAAKITDPVVVPSATGPLPSGIADNSSDSTDMWPVAKDAARAVKIVIVSDWRRIVRCFVYLPIGIFAILAACYGVSCLLLLGDVAFPASVACLVLLFLGLLLCEAVIGNRKTKALVRIINVPGGWSLRWLNLFFTPSFVMLPLSPRISGAEIGKMIAVFVIGFVVMLVATAYMVRGIQLLVRRPRKALHQRTESVRRDGTVSPGEGGEEHEDDQDEELTPLRADFGSGSCDGIRSMPPVPPQSHAAAYITIRGQNLDDPLSSFSDVPAPYSRILLLRHQSSARAVSLVSGGAAVRSASTSGTSTPIPMTRADRWAEWLGGHADALLFAALGLFVGVPLYYSVGYAMPLQLSVNVLLFIGAMSLPASWRQILHPVLVSAFSTLLVIWLLGRVRGDSLVETLDSYKPGHTYLYLWENPSAANRAPGAGDMLVSALDASIVSLALPMYQYRHELRRHFLAIVVPTVSLSVISLYVYPIVCYHIGINATRSLAFTSRSLTLALAVPAVRNLGGDINTAAAVAILSGVLGVLIGRRILSWLRIPDDDYVTRGVTLGANASALGTALLLRIDPRAAAISSLAMGLFGAITVAFSSIPPIVHIIRSLVGLS
ncbi:hypothetical protein SCUCBS95973_001803 [Sporothrix curviconia]|uniref:LrgB-like protein n=1 Tax=Sporothrix curviconia TaxID=1260050 RepID=A0ABP0B1Q5_9PEZI